MAKHFTHTDFGLEKVMNRVQSGIHSIGFMPRISSRLKSFAVAPKASLSPVLQIVSYRAVGKRLLDLVIVILALPVVINILLVLAILVAQDGGAPFYRHRRIGRNGKTFGCLKVRTMTTDATERLQALLESDPAAAYEWQQTQKLHNDPRITKVGKFLRKTSLDELPQLWNVLVGDMSLVGPRPVTSDELARFGTSSEAYKSVRPGITGAWQIDPTRNAMTYDERVAIEASYAKQVSFMGDLKVLIGTLKWAMAPNGR